MANCDVTPVANPSTRFIVSFDIGALECEALMKLFRETTSHMPDIRVERMIKRRRYPGQQEHPAMTLGITVRRPTIRFSDWLDREQRIGVIAHELLHILLVYRYELRMVDRRIPYQGSNEDIFDYYLNLNRHWKYLVEQIINTIHHQILIDYLSEEYGIESNLQFNLLRHNFHIACRSYYPDRESQYATGLIAFEHEKRMGRVDRPLNLYPQSDFFWKAYETAQKHFGSYSFKEIPAPSTYEEDIFSFLEDLGYQRRHFTFVPKIPSDSGPTGDSEELPQRLPSDGGDLVRAE